MPSIIGANMKIVFYLWNCPKNPEPGELLMPPYPEVPQLRSQELLDIELDGSPALKSKTLHVGFLLLVII